MDQHPTTFAGESHGEPGVEWNDSAALHLANDGDGVFEDFKSIRRGTLAELVRQVAAMPEEEGRRYVIQKAGDHKIDYAGIMALANRPDLPPR